MIIRCSPEVDNCCYFISLKTGAKIFGFLTLITSLLLCILSGLEIAAFTKYAKEDSTGIVTALIIENVMHPVQIATSVCLLVGVYQENPKLLPPWMISSAVAAVVNGIIFPSFVSVIFTIGLHYQQSSILWILFTIICLLDDLYGLLVVYSYYRSLSTRY